MDVLKSSKKNQHYSWSAVQMTALVFYRMYNNCMKNCRTRRYVIGPYMSTYTGITFPFSFVPHWKAKPLLHCFYIVFTDKQSASRFRFLRIKRWLLIRNICYIVFITELQSCHTEMQLLPNRSPKPCGCNLRSGKGHESVIFRGAVTFLTNLSKSFLKTQ